MTRTEVLRELLRIAVRLAEMQGEARAIAAQLGRVHA